MRGNKKKANKNEERIEREREKQIERQKTCALLLRSWILRTFWVGYRRDLEVTDLYKPLNEHTSAILGVKIADAWKKECTAAQCRGKGARPSLLKVIIRCFGFKIFLYGIVLAVMEIALRYVCEITLVIATKRQTSNA